MNPPFISDNIRLRNLILKVIEELQSRPVLSARESELLLMLINLPLTLPL